MIWFPGDKVRATVHDRYTEEVEGVIEDFDCRLDGHLAIIRLSVPAGSFARGDLVQVPVTGMKEVA